MKIVLAICFVLGLLAGVIGAVFDLTFSWGFLFGLVAMDLVWWCARETEAW